MTDYYLLIIGPDGDPIARAVLDCDDDRDAVNTAQDLISPHGHALFAGTRFLGRFESSWGEHLKDDPAGALAPDPPPR